MKKIKYLIFLCLMILSLTGIAIAELEDACYVTVDKYRYKLGETAIISIEAADLDPNNCEYFYKVLNQNNEVVYSVNTKDNVINYEFQKLGNYSIEGTVVSGDVHYENKATDIFVTPFLVTLDIMDNNVILGESIKCRTKIDGKRDEKYEFTYTLMQEAEETEEQEIIYTVTSNKPDFEYNVKEEGMYYLKVEVKDSQGNISADEGVMPISVSPFFAYLNFKTSVIKLGEKYRLSVYTDGKPDAVYKYVYKIMEADTNKQIFVQESNSSQFEYNTEQVGSFYANVEISDGEHTETFGSDFGVISFVASINQSAREIKPKDKVDFEIEVDDDKKEGYEYKYEIFNTNFESVFSSQYGKENTFSYIFNDEGLYTVEARARNSKGEEQIVYSDTIDVRKFRILLLCDRGNAKLGESVTFNCYSDGDGKYSYNYKIIDTVDFSIVGEYKDQNQIFSHSFNKIGVYNIEVVVRDEEGYEETDSFYGINISPFFVQAFSNKYMVKLGEEASFKAIIEGLPNAKYTYKITIAKYEDDEIIHEANSDTPEFRYSFDKADSYGVNIYVTDENGFTQSGFTSLTATNWTVNAKVNKAEVKEGHEVELNINVEGTADSNYEYSYDIYDIVNSATTEKFISSSSTFRHRFVKEGLYYINVEVKDSTGFVQMVNSPTIVVNK